jgi:hypothetical protein
MNRMTILGSGFGQAIPAPSLGRDSPIRSVGAFPGCLTVERLVSVGMTPPMAKDDCTGGGTSSSLLVRDLQ